MPSEAEDRFDYENGSLDDVVVHDVSLFRMEWMSDRSVWLRCYREGKPDLIFWLNSAQEIKGSHEID